MYSVYPLKLFRVVFTPFHLTLVDTVAFFEPVRFFSTLLNDLNWSVFTPSTVKYAYAQFCSFQRLIYLSSVREETPMYSESSFRTFFDL